MPDIVASLSPRARPERARYKGWPTEIAAELFAQQLVRGQALATGWDDNRSTPREVMRRRLGNSAWLGLERIVAGERWTG